MRKIIYSFITWRILLFIPLIVSQIFLKVRAGFEYTSPSHFLSTPSNLISNPFISPWANFDGVYYLIIASGAYSIDNAGFFPLFPLSIYLARSIFPTGGIFIYANFFTALILSLVFTFLGLVFFEKLLKVDYKKNISFQSILFLLLFPTSFFLAAIYSESLFFLLLILSFYFARKEKWFLSSIFAMLLTATRFVGIAIIPALLIEFFIQNKTILSRKIISLFLIPFGLIFYSLFNFFEWGRPLQFISAQGALHNNRSVDSIVLFPQTIFRYFKILTTVSIGFEWWVALLELSTFIFVCVMLYIAWKKKVRISYLIFSLFAFLIPISSGTFSGLPRYSLVLFPIFIALALIKNKYIKIIYSIIGIILLFVLFMFFSKGYYIA